MKCVCSNQYIRQRQKSTRAHVPTHKEEGIHKETHILQKRHKEGTHRKKHTMNETWKIYTERQTDIYIYWETHAEKETETHTNKETHVEISAYRKTLPERDTESWDQRGPERVRTIETCRDVQMESETRKEIKKKKDTHGYAQAEGENSQRQKHSLTKRWLEREEGEASHIFLSKEQCSHEERF